MFKIKILLFIYSLIIFNHAFSESITANELFEKGLKKNKSYHYVDASVYFTQAIAKKYEFPEAYYQRGLSFQGMGEIKQAIKDYNQAINQGLKNVDVYLKLISHYKNAEQFQSAILICQKLIQAMPENAAGAYYDMGKIYEKSGNIEWAIKSYEKSLLNTDDEFEEFKNQLQTKIESLKPIN